MTITVTGITLSEQEKQAYVDYVQAKRPGQPIEYLSISGIADAPDEVNLEYQFAEVPFERIRRITGYLVGTVDRFNDAKRAEVNDRVKHAINTADAMERI